MGTVETGRYDFNNYNNPFEQLKPSLEDARNHPELQLPPKIEAALEMQRTSLLMWIHSTEKLDVWRPLVHVPNSAL